jgi:DNA polymerase III subunit alpha
MEETIAIQCQKCKEEGRDHTELVYQSDFKAIMNCEKCGQDTFWEVVVNESGEVVEEKKPPPKKVFTADDFVHLHVHSEYSLLDGFGHPEEYIKRVKEIGQKAVAITDHGSIAAHYKWFDACTKEGLKPILGCEMYVVDDVSVKERKRHHITILAKTNEGLVNLNKLVSFSYAAGFYYRPRVDWDQLAKFHRGLIATSGCPASKTGSMVVHEHATVDDIAKELKRQQLIFGGEYFVEMSPWSYPEGKQYAKIIYAAAEKAKIPIVLTMDVHYPKKEQQSVQDVMLCIQTRSRYRDTSRMKFSQTDFYVKTGEEMEESWRTAYPDLQWKDSLIKNTKVIADKIKITFPKAKSVTFDSILDKEEHLREVCEAQLKARGLSKNKEYTDRAKRELDLIVEKKFIDYFLVISDVVSWAKSQGIYVGAARGSSCGSLVCYLLNITTVDPMPYGLLFERFIDINRADLPDIDMDFEDERREEVKKYLMSKYGVDRVASLSTYGTFRGRMCLQDVGKVFDVPPSVVAEVKELVVQRQGGDSRYSFSVEDTFTSFDKAAKHLQSYPQLGFAKHLEGYIRNKGVHAAGVIISNDPIENFASCYYDSKTGDRIIHMDYDDIKAIGLLKIDILGLTALTIFKKASQLIKKRKGVEIDFQSINLEDEKVLTAFRKGKMFGIFQFDGQAVMGVARQVQPKNFRELVATNALGRPGALHSGSTSLYIDRKDGKEKIDYVHPLVKQITEETYGVAIYQEQVMNIVRYIGCFDWEGIGAVRKLMSKSQGVEAFNKYREEFVKGALTHKISDAKANELWKSICTFGSWAFNKSHSVAYTTMGFWMMWLKVYYPLEFYCAMLQCEKDDDSKKKIIKEFVNDGGNLYPVNVNHSKQRMTIDKKGLRVGLLDVKGIGESLADKIVQKQPYRSVADLKGRLKKDAAVEALLKIGACDGLLMGHQDLTLNLFPDIEKEALVPPPVPKTEDIIDLCPSMIVDKVHAHWKDWVEETIDSEINTKKGKDNYELLTIRQVEKLKKRTNVSLICRTNRSTQFNSKNRIDEAESKGTTMAIEAGKRKDDYDIIDFTVDDETSFVICRLSHDVYPKFKNMLWEVKPHEVLLVSGWVSPDFMMIFTKSVINLSRLRAKLDGDGDLTEDERKMLKKGVL